MSAQSGCHSQETLPSTIHRYRKNKENKASWSSMRIITLYLTLRYILGSFFTLVHKRIVNKKVHSVWKKCWTVFTGVKAKHWLQSLRVWRKNCAEIPDKWPTRTVIKLFIVGLQNAPIASIDIVCEHSMIKSKFKNSQKCEVYKFLSFHICGIPLLHTIFVYSNRIKDWRLVQKNLFLDMICKILQGLKTSSIKGALLDKEA